MTIIIAIAKSGRLQSSKAAKRTETTTTTRGRFFWAIKTCFVVSQWHANCCSVFVLQCRAVHVHVHQWLLGPFATTEDEEEKKKPVFSRHDIQSTGRAVVAVVIMLFMCILCSCWLYGSLFPTDEQCLKRWNVCQAQSHSAGTSTTSDNASTARICAYFVVRACRYNVSLVACEKKMTKGDDDWTIIYQP